MESLGEPTTDRQTFATEFAKALFREIVYSFDNATISREVIIKPTEGLSVPGVASGRALIERTEGDITAQGLWWIAVLQQHPSLAPPQSPSTRRLGQSISRLQPSSRQATRNDQPARERRSLRSQIVTLSKAAANRSAEPSVIILPWSTLIWQEQTSILMIVSRFRSNKLCLLWIPWKSHIPTWNRWIVNGRV
ncbi:hypothetical protein BJ508DRAFT_313124 [Ascobolus immersus RN42]|uniref:Uncharacterized protein n=1 Tax=Ascobolus immersus RN42 TaxID=1160509 RepID=A0A3N4HQ31_ASCIM|nr:hypothetical protein BJ508DRAFT_313124 [Ascobolus immersus RN42]